MAKSSSLIDSGTVISKELGTFLEPVKEELDLVEKFLITNLVDDSVFIQEVLAQVFKSGGKRLRPLVVLLVAKATATDKLENLPIILAVLTELIHSASLVHDDVIDGATLRRGQETISNKWSDKLAVLTGDLLFAQASICLARLMNPRIVGIYGQVLGDLCAGEIRQMQQQFVVSASWENYIQKSRWKTASLFAAGSQSAAILNNCPEDFIASMNNYGLNFGTCFQIIDDLLDMVSTNTTLGKPAGCDLAQGLVTAPAIFVLEKQNAMADKLSQLIQTKAVINEEGKKEALSIIYEQGGIESTIKLAQTYANLAKEALMPLPQSIYKESLTQLTDWLLTRTS